MIKDFLTVIVEKTGDRKLQRLSDSALNRTTMNGSACPVNSNYSAGNDVIC